MAIAMTSMLFLIPFTSNSQFLDHGSLVVLVPSKDGLIVVSEKRVVHIDINDKSENAPNKETLSDTTVKIEQLNNYYGFSVTGIRRWGNNNIESFNAMRIVKDYFKAKSTIDLDEDIEQLRETLGVEMKKNVGGYLMTKNRPETVTTVLIFGFNKVKEKYQVALIKLFLVIEMNQIKLRPTSFIRKEFGSSLITRAGFENVIEKLEGEQNEKLNRSMKELLSKKDAITLSKYLISETSKSTDSVGEIVDIVLVNKLGFCWIGK